MNAGEKYHKSSMYVVNGLKRPILDFKSLVSLGLINEGWPNVCALSLEKARRQLVDVLRAEGDTKVKEEFFSEFPEVFPDDEVVQPLAKMTGPEMKIELVEGAKPYKRNKANNIPLHWREPVKKQLDTMVEKDIAEIVPVGENPECFLGMVCVAKKGKINDPRITVDFKPVNRYVKRLGYPTKVPAEKVMDIPPGMKFFTVLDGRHGYWQVPLSEESKKYTCFITPRGLYRFKRNVMGLISAGDEHNLRGDRALAGMENVKKIVEPEDIVIYEKDREMHLARVREVLERCQAAGIMLHKKKANLHSQRWSGAGTRSQRRGISQERGKWMPSHTSHDH